MLLEFSVFKFGQTSCVTGTLTVGDYEIWVLAQVRVGLLCCAIFISTQECKLYQNRI